MATQWKQIAVSLLIIVLVVVIEVNSEKTKKLQIGVKKKVENCARRSKNGDRLSMHYTVSTKYNNNVL